MNNTGKKSYEKLSGKRKIAVLKRIFKYMMKYKWHMLIAFLIMVVSNILALAGPKLSGKAIAAIDLGADKVDFEQVFYYCSLLAICYLLSAILSYCLSVLMIHISKKIVYTMRKELFDHLMILPVNYFDTHATGNIISHISYDIDTVNASLSSDLLQVCTSLITVVGSLIMMLSIAPFLICVFLITVPISLIFTRYKSRKVRPLFKKRSEKLGELNGYAEEMLSGQKSVKGYAREDVIVDRFNKRNLESVDAYYKAEYYGVATGPVVGFINNLSISLVTTLGGIFYMLTMTLGAALPPIFRIGLDDVSAFLLYSRKFAGPINEFANIMNDIQSSLAAAERVFNLIDESPETPDSVDAKICDNVKGDVVANNVCFGYVPEKTIIKNLSFEAIEGKTVAIVGPTGAGKTTIINLLMRFYDIDSGKILLDGSDIRGLTRSSLRRSYTMVLQDTWLFCGTIADNIKYGREDASYEDVINAAKAAKIHSYIETLPNGYNTVITDDGANISKGQKQLLTIARAMLAQSPILILDEATSNVDSRTEIKIQDAMKKLMENRTSFVIAHRLSTVQNADVILVFRDGEVIEQGTHDELIGAQGFYHSLYNSQFEQ